MKKIENTKLEDLVKIASEELLQEMRTEGISQIKRLFSKINILSREINEDSVKLQKKKESLANAESTLSKIKEGDWNALQEENK